MEETGTEKFKLKYFAKIAWTVAQVLADKTSIDCKNQQFIEKNQIKIKTYK